MVRDLNAADDDEDREAQYHDFSDGYGAHLRTEKRQGLIGMGARTDFPNNDNHWGYGYLDASHGFPPRPNDPHGRPLSETEVAAYHDGYQTARPQSRTAAVPHPKTTISHPQTAIGETKYSLSCEKCGHYGQHEDYDIAHALAEDHQNQHWVSAHDDKYGQGNHEREFPWMYQGSLSDGSSTDGKIIGQCPGCTKPIRKHQTAHGDELRHLHNNHVRCFGKTAAEGPALLEAADVGGKALKGAEDELEKPADEWAYRAESALQMYADYLGRPDAQNPTGRGPDEYRARTWNAYETTKPMQSVEDRGVNTPVLPADPLKTRNINTPTPGLRGRDDDLRHSDDEDDDED